MKASPSTEPAVSQEPPPAGAHGFQRRLGLFDATTLVAGSMIGSGIFIVSAAIVREVGSAGWLLLVWGLSGLITILGALSYAELAGMMPNAGGQYVYLCEAYSPLWGFLYGWTCFLVIQTGFIAAVSVAFAKFLGVLIPVLGTDYVLWSVGKFSLSSGQLVAVGVVVLLTFLNLLGVHAGKWVQNIFTVAKTLGLLLLIVLGLTLALNPEAVSHNLADVWGGIWTTEKYRDVLGKIGGAPALVALMVLGGAMVGALFSSDAWNNITFAAGEIRNPRRNLPLSLALGTVLVITLYLLANLAYLAALPVQGIAHAKDDRVGTAVLAEASPDLGVRLMALIIMVSTFGCVNGIILMSARLFYAMARDGLFFQAVGRLSARGVPAAGLVLQAAWAVVLIFSGTYSDLLDYIIFAALMFYALTVAGLFVLRRKWPDADRPYRAVGYPVLPALYVGLCAVIMLDLLIVKPLYTWPGLILVVAGVPVYFVWRGRASKFAKSALQN